MSESFVDERVENVTLSQEEIEKLVEGRKETEPFRKLVDSGLWEPVKENLKEDLYQNVIFNEDALKALIGIKRVIERVEWMASQYDEISEKLSSRE